MNKLLKFIIFFYCCIIFNVLSNEIVNIKTYDRDDYIRIMFELTKKPDYFVTQEKEKIIIKLSNTYLNSPMHKNINKFNVINDILLFNENQGIKFVLLLNNNATMKRYLYTDPSKVTKYYRLIVDIYKREQKFENLDNIILSGIAKQKLFEEKQTNNIKQATDSGGRIERTKNPENIKLTNNINRETNRNDNIILVTNVINDNAKTINDLIVENVKPTNINELLDLNNITEEQITKNIEDQNNEKIDLDSFLKKISTKLDDNTTDNVIKSKENNVNKIITKNNAIKKQKQFIVVIDAGHGGKDSGAIGSLRTKEKNINLAVAKTIKYELDKNKNLKVYLTRNSDIFIELYERVNRARNLRADLFISIHSDSNPNKKARGLSIYTLMKSASDKRTAAFSVIKNKNDVVKGVNLLGSKQETIDVILDISRYKTLNESTKFTQKLITSFKKNNINMLHDPHKYGNFAVLLAPEYPSVLIELGFISNLKDERMLQTSNFRKKVSVAIAEAVRLYFSR